MGYAWRVSQLFGTGAITLANVCATCIAWDDIHFPHMMLSDYVAHPKAAPIANVWWTVYILLHLPFELRLLHRVNNERKDRSPAANSAAWWWNLTFVAIAIGWLSMWGCLKWDIRAHPSIHSIMGGIYGAGWLTGQGLRYLFCDAHRPALGLAPARRSSEVRGFLCACEVLTVPFIGAGMLLPLASCPDWLSWACIWLEHVFMIYGRSVIATAAYYVDMRHMDVERTVAAPLKRVSSGAKLVGGVRNFADTLKTTQSAVETKMRTRKDGSARRRLTVGFRSSMLRGL